MLWLYLTLLGLFLVVVVPPLAVHIRIVRKYLPYLVRILQEKPLFIIPHGQPQADAEHVIFPTTHGLSLHGCYLPTRQPRTGVILFGLEFGTNCWACQPYCEFLRENGYDIFSFETRGQGTAPAMMGTNRWSG